LARAFRSAWRTAFLAAFLAAFAARASFDPRTGFGFLLGVSTIRAAGAGTATGAAARLGVAVGALTAGVVSRRSVVAAGCRGSARTAGGVGTAAAGRETTALAAGARALASVVGAGFGRALASVEEAGFVSTEGAGVATGGATLGGAAGRGIAGALVVPSAPPPIGGRDGRDAGTGPHALLALAAIAALVDGALGAGLVTLGAGDEGRGSEAGGVGAEAGAGPCAAVTLGASPEFGSSSQPSSMLASSACGFVSPTSSARRLDPKGPPAQALSVLFRPFRKSP
jgi:hypothetical protein